MCDYARVAWLVAGGMAGLLVAIGLVLTAIPANASFFGAWASTGLMIGAGVATLAAFASLRGAMAALETWFNCITGRRGGECTNLFTALRASLAGMLLNGFVLAAACFSAAAGAWVPWLGQVAMWPILFTMIAAVIGMFVVAYLLLALVLCIQLSVGSTTMPITSPTAPRPGAGGHGLPSPPSMTREELRGYIAAIAQRNWLYDPATGIPFPYPIPEDWCPMCTLLLTRGGRLAEVELSQGTIATLVLEGGDLVAYAFSGTTESVPYTIRYGRSSDKLREYPWFSHLPPDRQHLFGLVVLEGKPKALILGTPDERIELRPAARGL